MSNQSDKDDPLAHACELVGRFQYYFARMEQKVDQAVIKLFDLDEKTANIITGSIDFLKKLNLVHTYVRQAFIDPDKKFAVDTCKRIFGMNNVRVRVIHSLFEPVSYERVQFKRISASDGRVSVWDEVWDTAKFSEQYEKMRGLAADLDKVIELLKPEDWFIYSTSDLSEPLPIAVIQDEAFRAAFWLKRPIHGHGRASAAPIRLKNEARSCLSVASQRRLTARSKLAVSIPIITGSFSSAMVTQGEEHARRDLGRHSGQGTGS